MTTEQLFLRAWTWQPVVVLAIGAMVGVHVARFRLADLARTGVILAAAATSAVALVSPVATLARGTLFSAHMLQHMLLVLGVPPLVLLAIPRIDEERAPGRGSPAENRWWNPVASWGAGVLAMWFWHIPVLCDAAARYTSVWALQTVSLLVMGAAFWWPILGPRFDHRLSDAAAIAYLLGACAACTVLGVALTFSPVQVCSVYARAIDPLGALPLLRDRWGLTPSVDQQLGGLLMWVPGCTAYASGVLAIVARFYAAPHVEAPEVP